MSTKSPNQSVCVKLTKRVVESLTPPESGQILARDSELKGFGLRLTPGGTRAFFIEKRIEGKVRRITLGRFPELTAEEGRKKALKELGAIAGGGNPIKAKRQEQFQGITLHTAFKAFRLARSYLKPKTLYDYERTLNVALGDWVNRPVRAITKDMVGKRYQQLVEKHGAAYANLTMRTLRAILNFAMAQYEDDDGNPIIADNPVMRLTRTRAWQRTERRQSVIRPHQLAPWYGAVQRLKVERPIRQPGTIADYLLLLLFTGMRRSEALNLCWEHVDLESKILTIPKTKNHEPLTLPLSDFLVQLLKAREEEASGPYVFPGEGPRASKNDKRDAKDKKDEQEQSPFVEPRGGVRWVARESGVPFTLHDLRRTFITVAESLDISAYALKRLVNHSMSRDVTAGYIISDVERLRAPMARISDFLLKACGVVPTADIVSLSPSEAPDGLAQNAT